MIGAQLPYPSLLLALHHLSGSLVALSHAPANLRVLESLLLSHRRHGLVDPISCMLEGVVLRMMGEVLGGDRYAIEATTKFQEVGRWVGSGKVGGGAAEQWIASHAV